MSTPFKTIWGFIQHPLPEDFTSIELSDNQGKFFQTLSQVCSYGVPQKQLMECSGNRLMFDTLNAGKTTRNWRGTSTICWLANPSSLTHPPLQVPELL